MNITVPEWIKAEETLPPKHQGGRSVVVKFRTDNLKDKAFLLGHYNFTNKSWYYKNVKIEGVIDWQEISDPHRFPKRAEQAEEIKADLAQIALMRQRQ